MTEKTQNTKHLLFTCIVLGFAGSNLAAFSLGVEHAEDTVSVVPIQQPVSVPEVPEVPEVPAVPAQMLGECAEALHECEEELELKQEMCTPLALEYMLRAKYLFKCEERLCSLNGWTKPGDWEETVKENQQVEANIKEIEQELEEKKKQ